MIIIGELWFGEWLCDYEFVEWFGILKILICYVFDWFVDYGFVEM